MNKGKLILSYWSAFNKTNNASNYCFSVSNTKQTNKFVRVLHGLTPGELAWDYKNGNITWEEYTKLYNKQLKTKKAKKDLDLIKSLLDRGHDVWIMCWEKNPPCHRFLIGEEISSCGYEVVNHKYNRGN